MVGFGYLVFIFNILHLCMTDTRSDEIINDTNCHKELAILKKQVNDLTRQMAEMATQIEKKNNHLQKRLLTPATSSPPATAVAFSVGLKHNINLGQDQIVEYDKVITNVGNGFDIRHNHFIAPVKGLYLFSSSLFTEHGYYVHTNIVKNGQPIGYLYSNENNHISTQIVLISMEVGDMVWVKHTGDVVGHALIYGTEGEQLNTFSGVLIQPIM